jgi:uncharacterized protein YggE
MRIATSVLLLSLALGARAGLAQVSGNVGYGQQGGRGQAVQDERAMRQVTREELPASRDAMYLDAAVLMNVKADEFVAVFGVAAEAETVEACQEKMDATIDGFMKSVEELGVARESIFVDLTAQTKIYGYKVEGSLAREQLTGFELKKTVSVRYRDRDLIDRLLAAASRRGIYDLVEVRYVVSDLAPIQERLAEAAAEAIKAKAARHERLLGVKLRPMPRVLAERSSAHYPTEMYDSYVAGESDTMAVGFDASRMAVQGLRKGRTFHYNPLTANGFDRVIDPAILEPVVQFTLYLKLEYEVDAGR